VVSAANTGSIKAVMTASRVPSPPGDKMFTNPASQLIANAPNISQMNPLAISGNNTQ